MTDPRDTLTELAVGPTPKSALSPGDHPPPDGRAHHVSPPAATSRVAPPEAGGETPTRPPVVIGVDLSLDGTGVASSNGWTERIEPKNLTGHKRLSMILTELSLLVTRDTRLIVVEGLYGVAQPGQHDRVGLLYLFTHGLWVNRRPHVIVAPASLKKYATGNGNASKDKVGYAAVRRFPDWDIQSNDEADAIWLMAMGRDHLGHPLATMPATHRKALDAVPWLEDAS